MSLTTIQGAYKTAQYIDGSYEAQYQFGILYRSLPTDSEERLDAESELNDDNVEDYQILMTMEYEVGG